MTPPTGHTGYSLTEFAQDKIGGALFGGTSFTAPAHLYLCAFTDGPYEDGTGTEVIAGGYTPMGVTFTPNPEPTLPNTGRLWVELTDIVFPTATADWGTLTGLGLRDAPSGGNLWLYTQFVTPMAVGSGSQFIIRSPNLNVLLD